MTTSQPSVRNRNRKFDFLLVAPLEVEVCNVLNTICIHAVWQLEVLLVITNS